MKIKKLKSSKGLHFYDFHCHQVVEDQPCSGIPVAISEKLLPPPSEGRSAINQKRLFNLKRGAKIEIAISDVIFPGECRYLTSRTTYMPKKLSDTARKDKKFFGDGGKWFTFLRPDGSLLFVMNMYICLAENARL